MDKSTSNKRERNQRGFFSGIIASIKAGIESRRGSAEAPFFDILVFSLAFLLSRTHIVFGAYPLAIAFTATLPSRVWISLFGAVLGSLSLGGYGVIYAMIAVITVFLRIIVSGTDKPREDGSIPPIFSENLLLRMSSALIGGFIGAVYEILLSGFTLATVMFGLSMVLLPPVLCFAFSGIFEGGVGFRDIFSDNRAVLSTGGKAERERFGLVFFQCAALLFIFLTSLSLRSYELIGINAAYLFSPAVTLFASRRFGALRGGAVGFAAGLCLSGTAAAAFALAGIAAGLLFRVGLAYAVIGGGVALSVYNAYTGGLGALLGALPEYAIAGALSIPLLKKISPEKTESEERETERSSEEMVGTMALSFKSRGGGAVSAVISSLSSLSSSARRHFPSSLRPRREELCDLILECAREYCRTCDGASSECICDGGTAELEREAGRIADTLYRSGKIRPDELPLSLSCKKREELATTINRAAAILAEKKYKASRGGRADELDLAARLISEAREADEREHALNEHLSGVCGEIITRHGLAGGTARVFGERRPHIIIAAEDERGTKISSSELLNDIESACGTRLGTPEFFRRGRMALLECSAARSFSAECATAGITGSRDEVSGDTSRAFETEDGYFFSLISDGMGSGEEARETSELVGELLSGGLEFGGGKETVMKLLNTLILSRPGECSATVDLFSLDLYRGEACFIKSGAASSYIKRSRAGGGSSLFRIRSHTAPIGLMRDVDAEKIRVEIESDDYIIMLSDGISQNNEDAPWLLELLSQPPKRTVAEYAEFILEGARKNVTPTDDMTVSVTKIIRI